MNYLISIPIVYFLSIYWGLFFFRFYMEGKQYFLRHIKISNVAYNKAPDDHIINEGFILFKTLLLGVVLLIFHIESKRYYFRSFVLIFQKWIILTFKIGMVGMWIIQNFTICTYLYTVENNIGIRDYCEEENSFNYLLLNYCRLNYKILKFVGTLDSMIK